MACEAVHSRACEDDDDESIAAFVRRRFGDEAVDYLAEPLLAGIHAGDVERLSVRALFPRLVDAERQSGSVIRAFRALRMRPSPHGAFVSLPGGVGELVDALVAAIPPGIITSSARVTELRHAGTLALETPGGPIQAKAVILAIPAYAAGGILRGVHTGLAALCEDVPYASTATVAFGYHRDQVGHRDARQRLRRAACRAEPTARRDLGHLEVAASRARGPRPAARISGRRTRPASARPDRRRTDRSRARGARGGHVASREPRLFSRLYRWTRQSPQHEVGHLERLADHRATPRTIPGLFVTGSGFRSIGIPDCIADGRETAARALRRSSPRKRTKTN